MGFPENENYDVDPNGGISGHPTKRKILRNPILGLLLFSSSQGRWALEDRSSSKATEAATESDKYISPGAKIAVQHILRHNYHVNTQS